LKRLSNSFPNPHPLFEMNSTTTQHIFTTLHQRPSSHKRRKTLQHLTPNEMASASKRHELPQAPLSSNGLRHSPSGTRAVKKAVRKYEAHVKENLEALTQWAEEMWRENKRAQVKEAARTAEIIDLTKDEVIDLTNDKDDHEPKPDLYWRYTSIQLDKIFSYEYAI
jgi:hypothetical protein